MNQVLNSKSIIAAIISGPTTVCLVPSTRTDSFNAYKTSHSLFEACSLAFALRTIVVSLFWRLGAQFSWDLLASFRSPLCRVWILFPDDCLVTDRACLLGVWQDKLFSIIHTHVKKGCDDFAGVSKQFLTLTVRELLKCELGCLLRC